MNNPIDITIQSETGRLPSPPDSLLPTETLVHDGPGIRSSLSSEEEQPADATPNSTLDADQTIPDEKNPIPKTPFPFLSPANLFNGLAATWKGPITDPKGQGSTNALGDQSTTTGNNSTALTNSHDEASTKSLLQQQSIPTESESIDLSSSISGTLEWTTEGPPTHWASGKSLEALFPVKTDLGNISSTTTTNSTVADDASTLHDAVEMENKESTPPMAPLHVFTNPFASVSRTLHENILVHFQPGQKQHLVEEIEEERNSSSKAGINDDSQPAESTVLGASDTPVETPSRSVEAETPQKNGEEAETNRCRLGLATVAGGIAGGVVGMAVAGPVGGIIGARFGQTAGILGVVLEGSWTIGVITSGIVAGSNAGQQLQDKMDEKRILTLTGSDTSAGVLLVRPSVRADPSWAIFCEDAKRSHKKMFGFNFLAPDSKTAFRERYEREIDIVNTDENEIPTAEKVLLLVSRMLNDKESLSGHVYRQLIEKFKERVASRGDLSEIVKAATSSKPNLDEDRQEEESSMEEIRARRQDAHSVIKYVTATLLELRPAFATSPAVTEYTATAVEALVFGEIYDLVIEEIEAEFEMTENELLEKVASFESLHAQDEDALLRYKSCISQDAIASLQNLPQAHSAVDKLRYCVIFLEKIADYFSSDSSQKPMGADSLLKLVCQHIIGAKIFGTNAQIAFLEEFARDEQLLRGKEGYALVTLQASLHFLNASSDFDADIFNQEDD